MRQSEFRYFIKSRQSVNASSICRQFSFSGHFCPSRYNRTGHKLMVLTFYFVLFRSERQMMDAIVPDCPVGEGVALMMKRKSVIRTSDPPPNGPNASPCLAKYFAIPYIFPLQIDKPARLKQLSWPLVPSSPASSSDGGEHVRPLFLSQERRGPRLHRQGQYVFIAWRGSPTVPP